MEEGRRKGDGGNPSFSSRVYSNSCCRLSPYWYQCITIHIPPTAMLYFENTLWLIKMPTSHILINWPSICSNLRVVYYIISGCAQDTTVYDSSNFLYI